jgi:hypothetical protein
MRRGPRVVRSVAGFGLAVFGLAVFLGAALYASTARASSLDASGHLVFDKDALLTEGFESFGGAQAQGASWLAWNIVDSALAATPVTMADWVASTGRGGGSGTVALPSALEGGHALELAVGKNVAFALVDPSFFKTLTSKRIEVTFWGFSMGAEPELDIVYPGTFEPVGPQGFANVIAIRTGRETSDGWAEYSTGPVDGLFFGDTAIATILLTARFPSDDGIVPLDSYNLLPPDGEQILDPGGYALADAIEVVPASGAPMPPTACTQATVATACGPLGECSFGRCVEGAAVWGPVPETPQYRMDLVNRWAFVAEHLGGDRKAASNAPGIFSNVAVSALASATTAPAFYGGLNTLVNQLHDGHTGLGVSPSDATQFYEAVTSSSAYSSLLDLCFGLAENDLPGADGELVYAVFWLAPESAVGSAQGGTLVPGDMLTEIDGMSPDAWLDTVGPRFREKLPNDPSSDPTGRALLLAPMIAKYASTATFSSCTATGSCTNKNVAVGDIAYAILTGTGYGSATTDSRLCSGRFRDPVSTWTLLDDEGTHDVPVTQSTGGISIVEFDGFEAAYDSSEPSNPYHAWVNPMNDALTSGQNILFDARLGHGGLFSLGAYLVHEIRGTASPYFTFAVPRGTWDEIDPAWLFDASLATCVETNDNGDDLCGWTGNQMDEATLANPPAGNVKVAWLNSRDVSMNDIVPRDLLGGPSFRVFGPLPTTGAYGEISEVPPIDPSWLPGSIQVLDMRFGSSYETAISAPWASGTGVPPDQVVVQKMSDLLLGTDTMLAAAEAWLAP